MTSFPNPEIAPGYRRRIVIEPSRGRVVTELEDDFHRMVVELTHEDGVITGVRSEMKRSPWTTCRGAMAVLEETFVGKRLDDPSVKQAKSLNCTHLYDLASFGAAHASETGLVVFDIKASDPVEGKVATRLYRDGQLLLDWRMDNGRFVEPQEIAGKGLTDINDWLAGLEGNEAEAARILRWASMVAGGRTIEMPAGMHAIDIGIPGACHTFQPGTIEESRRMPDAEVDFSRDAEGPMADRAERFDWG